MRVREVSDAELVAALTPATLAEVAATDGELGAAARDRIVELDGPRVCGWFLLCDNPATTTRRGPTPAGPERWGDIPICERCDARLTRMESD